MVKLDQPIIGPMNLQNVGLFQVCMERLAITESLVQPGGRGTRDQRGRRVERAPQGQRDSPASLGRLDTLALTVYSGRRVTQVRTYLYHTFLVHSIMLL